VSEPDFKHGPRIVNPKAGIEKVNREGRCRICRIVGRHLSQGGTLNRMHLVARSQGGDDVDENIVPGCGSGSSGCHGLIEAWDIGARATLRETFGMEEVAYIVGKKSPDYLEHAYPSEVILCGRSGKVERIVAGLCESCGEPAHQQVPQ
jgi:hypothetical protein